MKNSFEIKAKGSAGIDRSYLCDRVRRIINKIGSSDVAVNLGVSKEKIAGLDVSAIIKKVDGVRELLQDIILENKISDHYTDFAERFATAMKFIDINYDKSLDDFKHLFRSSKLTKRLKKIYEFLRQQKIEDDEDVSQIYYHLCLSLKSSYENTIYTTNDYTDKLTMSFGDGWESCQKIAPQDLPKHHPLYDYNDGYFDSDEAGCYASNATSVALDENIHMIYTSKDGEPYNMTHRALAIEIEQKDFNAIQLERVYPDEQSSSNSMAETALHNAFIEATKRLAKICFPDVEKWVVARGVRLATTSYFYLDSENQSRNKTFVVFPASVCGDEDPQEWMDNYQVSGQRRIVRVGCEPECTHCHTYIDSGKERAVCSDCGGYGEDEDDEPFAWCEHCEDGIQWGEDAVIGLTMIRHDVERHYFCCDSCAENDGYYPVEDPNEGDWWHDDDVTIDIDGNRWLNADDYLTYSDYQREYIPNDRAVWSEYLDSHIDQNNTVFDGFYGEDGDEIAGENIHEDEVVYSELRKCYILLEYAEKHPVTQDWYHRDWDVKDESKVVVNGKLLPIEDTVYSRTLGMRIAKATAWYPDGEEYNPEYVLPAEFNSLRQIVLRRTPYLPNRHKRVLVHRELFEATNYYLDYARSLYERMKQIGKIDSDERGRFNFDTLTIDSIRWNLGDIFSIFVNDITLNSEGKAEKITYELRPSYYN